MCVCVFACVCVYCVFSCVWVCVCDLTGVHLVIRQANSESTKWVVCLNSDIRLLGVNLGPKVSLPGFGVAAAAHRRGDKEGYRPKCGGRLR